MRILFLLTQDLTSPSGLGRYFPMARNLVRHGHEVRIIATHANFSELQDRHLSLDGVSIVYVSQMHVKKTGNRKSYYPFIQLIWNIFLSTIRLSVAALAQPVDLVMVGKPHPMNGIAGLLTLIFRRCFLIVDIDDDEAGSGYFQAKWQRDVVKWFSLFIPKTADWIITNTNYMMRHLEAVGFDCQKIFYLPNGVDVDRFQKPSPNAIDTLRDKLKTGNKKVILYMGSLSLASHAVDVLIDSMEILSKDRKDILLLVVGGGEDYITLREQVKQSGLEDTIIFCGRVEPTDVVNFYALADLAIDPVRDNDASRGRNPLKMFESWINAVPFLTSNVGDRESLAGNPPAALLIEPGSPQAMAKGIQEIIDSPELSDQLRKAGLHRVENFTWDALVKTLNHEIETRFILSK